MDLRLFGTFSLLISASLQTLEAREEKNSRSVVFFDSPSHSYIRHRPLWTPDETNSMQLDEVAAAVSVLLGLAPPSSLSAESSSKLNDVLLPNPFERPDTVLLLEVGGIDGVFLSTQHSDFKAGNSFHSTLLGSNKAKIHVAGEGHVYVVRIDETTCGEDNDSCFEQELVELAKWFGGSYTGNMRSNDAVLTIPLSTGSSLDLHVAKETDRAFAASVTSLIENTKRSALLNEFSQSSIKSKQLFIGRFRGLEALEVEYGQGDTFKHGEQLLKDTLVKLFNTLQTSSSGKVVFVLVSSKDPNQNTENMLEVTQLPHSTRWLAEIGSDNETIAEIKQVLLVRRTLAWITAIILLISTLIGVYFLMCMPLTRDTLLYSNVKLD
ncbi:hypothetical protein KSP40_PGU006622 [Platanthera guangdongensis]|uniref:DUF7794 domain-containing protein n=1 Tax=Platanthera guangdongensis TaxID=2320717 RepID=A0ABR2M9T5_9ASPA